MYHSEKPIIQIAYAVENVHNAAKYWSRRFNIGPFYVNEHIKLENTIIKGQFGTFDHSSAYGWKENLMIELICDHCADISPTPERNASGGVHHIAWIANDFEKERKELLSQGCEEVLIANVGHREGMRFSWFDPGEDIGHLFEIYENGKSLTDFYSFLHKASLNWDGKKPVRNVSEIT
ncbi:MAG: hypothetical protein CML96_05925 [Rhodobiaceae bacterium]|nr:hypothetical protein [Rhodobiaceae bacterium]